MNTLRDPAFVALLDRLYAEADASSEAFRQWVAEQPAERVAAIRSDPTAWRELYHAAKDAHLAVERPAAELLYVLARNRGARHIVEFGTSFGLSTLHLAAAVRDNGGGMVIGSEFEPGKVAQARRHLGEAGLGDLVDIRDGDALETLASGLPDVIDMVFLDGAKPLYLPVLRLLERHLAADALVVADNVDNAPDYAQHIRSSADYLSVDVDGRVEVTLRVSNN